MIKHYIPFISLAFAVAAASMACNTDLQSECVLEHIDATLVEGEYTLVSISPTETAITCDTETEALFDNEHRARFEGEVYVTDSLHVALKSTSGTGNCHIHYCGGQDDS